MDDKTIYLDYAAATPVSRTVFSAMQPYFSERFFNPSATYLAAMAVKKDFEAARATVAKQLGVRPIEITFTAGGTEANNLAIHGVMQLFPDKKIVTSAIEHDSVLMPAQQYANALVQVNDKGQLDLVDLEQKIDDDTVLVSIMYANNEIGVLQQIGKISQIINKVRIERRAQNNDLPLYLHSDACQAALYLDLHISRLGVDMLTLNGGKMYGPKQSGILCVKSGTRLAPQLLGGGQERGVRSGTENVAFAVGFARALMDAQTNRQAEGKRLQDLQQYFTSELTRTIPTVKINGSLRNRLPNNVHITVLGTDNETVLFGLDEQGILAAAGSACSASSDEPSHVLRAIGCSDDEAQASLRFSMGHSTTREQIDRVVKALSELVSR